MEITVAVVGVITEEGAVVIQRTKLAGVVLGRVVGGKVNDYLDAILMSCRNHGIKIGPGVARVTEVFFYPFEVATLITMIRRRRIATAVGNINVQIIDWRRNPNGSNAHARQVGHLLLNALQIAAPVEPPVSFRRV